MSKEATFTAYKMKYKGGLLASDLKVVTFEEKFYAEYKKVYENRFYEMSKALNRSFTVLVIV